MHIERTLLEMRAIHEKRLSHVLMKMEVKTHVKEYALEKASHYLTLSEKLGAELRELNEERLKLETVLDPEHK